MAESNPLFEFAQLWESTKVRANEIGLDLRTVEGTEGFAFYDLQEFPVFSAALLSSCSAFIDGVSWERAPQG